jgi:formiminotetrahydrofolate cyclodeaminase
MSEQRSVPEFLAALGSSAATPGGGAASALAGALGAALTEMVAQLTVGRPRFAQVDEAMRAVVTQAQRIRADLLALMEEDEQAYAAVAAAYKLPKTSEEEQARRDEAVQLALRAAMEPPLHVMERACDAMDLASEVAASGNPSVASDAGCAALLGEAAVRTAGLNVLANVVLLRDQEVADQAREQIAGYEERAEALRERTLAAVHTRIGG